MSDQAPSTARGPSPGGAATASNAPSRVLLVNMGGPSSRQEVRPYLEAIFADPAILPVPSLLRRPLGWWIARRRAPRVAERYEQIGGSSPLGHWTARQSAQVSLALRELGQVAAVTYAFRYTRPSIAEAIGAAAAAGARRVVLVPLFPHFTRAMTGSVVEVATAATTARGLELDVLDAFGAEPEILACWATRLERAVAEAGDGARVLFVAHGIPERSVRRGEDYPERVADTARELGARLPAGVDWSLAFQSRLGPVRWTRPYLDEELERLCADRAPLVIMPLSFVADCLETLYDLDVVATARARAAAVRSLVRVPVFNDDADFAAAIAAVVVRTRP